MEDQSGLPVEPLSPEVIQHILEQYDREGFAVVRGVLSSQEVKALREKADELMDDPALVGSPYLTPVANTTVLRYTHVLAPVFAELLVREPILSLVEAVLGPHCMVCGANVIRGRQGEAISSWHVDDLVEIPAPDDVPRHDPRIRMPVQWLTVQVALTDIDTLENGPTQVVPGSHYSGRRPNSQENPEFDGRGAEPILCKAGDIYLQNHQCWHRGAPNLSTRTRYLLQSQYGQWWLFNRFGDPYVRANLPESITASANPALARLFKL